MIELYGWYTSNVKKIAIMLEETGLAYQTRIVDIGRGEQFEPAFLAISPNNKVPALVDRDGPGGQPISLFESGAILVYLAEKTGRFWPAAGAQRHEAMQWLMFQMASVGPMFGQANHFRAYAPEKSAYAIDRYTKENQRLYRVMERGLRDRDYFAGDYSIADMALYPWATTFGQRDQPIDELPRVGAWLARMGARPAVQRAMAALAQGPRSGPVDQEHWENMYGATQYRRR